MDRIKGPWSPEEDDLLQQLVQKHGPRNWSLISKSIPGRSECNFISNGGYDGNLGGDERPPLKRSVSAGLYMSPGSPSGSDVSDSSVPVSSSHVYKPIARTGGVNVDVNVMPAGLEATSSSNDPPTSLSLSLPGVESCEVSTHPTVTTESTQTRNEGKNEERGSGVMGFSAEFMAVMQEMIRVEVRNYMMQMQQQNGSVGGVRNGDMFGWRV
ncbi:hypothetical protein CCACVL1_26438 [Corchorus capsularis]|uniref:Uncharacterized protein n=1 Tax=Corchorus capsularis TaxID=210143 RepID=A0A1R3GES6_COCAP|nr:hypothetical protein CCACVL1_26438 [Corchorus capsularis]